MATGTPVAGYPVSGPIDIIPGSEAGAVNDDLKTACLEALEMKRESAVAHAKNYSWDAVSDVFFNYLTPEYTPQSRKRWRRIRRLGRLASSPYHMIKRNARRVWRIMRGKPVP